MSGCDGCWQDVKQQHAALQSAEIKARELAEELKKNVFIYKDETQTWRYIEEEAGRAAGIYPTGGIVSYLR